MNIFLKNIWLETEALAQLCKSHYCPRELLDGSVVPQVREHICSQKLCKLVEASDWRDVARAMGYANHID